MRAKRTKMLRFLRGKLDLSGERSLFEKVTQINKEQCLSLIKISSMVCKLWPCNDFKMPYEVKFDLGGLKSCFDKDVQFNEKHC